MRLAASPAMRLEQTSHRIACLRLTDVILHQIEDIPAPHRGPERFDPEAPSNQAGCSCARPRTIVRRVHGLLPSYRDKGAG